MADFKSHFTMDVSVTLTIPEDQAKALSHMTAWGSESIADAILKCASPREVSREALVAFFKSCAQLGPILDQAKAAREVMSGRKIAADHPGGS